MVNTKGFADSARKRNSAVRMWPESDLMWGSKPTMWRRILSLILASAVLDVCSCELRQQRPKAPQNPPKLAGFEYIGKNLQGYHEYMHRKTGIIMVHIPGGSFWMGEKGHVHARPIHRVVVTQFLIGKYEVSQKEWQTLMEKNPSKWIGDDLPVHGISWSDAVEFCKRAGLALPSEAQWEYACRAGTRTRFYFGHTITLRDANFGFIMDRHGKVIPEGAFGRPLPCKSFRPNGYGLYNMHGNVAEWCLDLYDPDFYSRPEAAGPDPVCRKVKCANPIYAKPPFFYATRGGSYASLRSTCSSGYRLGLVDARFEDLGLRPVFPIKNRENIGRKTLSASGKK